MRPAAAPWWMSSSSSWVLNGQTIDGSHCACAWLFVYLNQSGSLKNAASCSQTSTSTPDQKQASLFGGVRAGSVSLLRSAVKSYSEAALPLFAASILIDVLSVGLTRLNIYPLFLSRRQIGVELHLFPHSGRREVNVWMGVAIWLIEADFKVLMPQPIFF